MKLMIITNNPTRASFRLRIEDHLDFLEKEGIRSTVFALPKKTADRWKIFRQASGYDALLLHRKCLNIWDWWFLSRHCPPVVFDFDDAIMHSSTKPESDRTSHYRLFKRTAEKATAMIAGNDNLAGYARKYCDRVHVLPTGLDVPAYFVPDTKKPDDRVRLVWIGSRKTLPYLAEIRPVLEQIGAENKNVVLRIIADRFFELENMEVEQRPWSLEGQVRDLRECDIGISPLPDNRFTRGKCAFKMLQYFATSLPVVASPVGTNRTFLEESGAGLLASTPAQWKEAILTMVADMDGWRKKGEGGRHYVRRFDKPDIARELARILKTATDR